MTFGAYAREAIASLAEGVEWAPIDRGLDRARTPMAEKLRDESRTIENASPSIRQATK
jgi:hypothetical protein